MWQSFRKDARVQKGGKMSVAEEVGRTARQAIRTWSETARLILLLLALALAASLFIAIRQLPLTMW